MDELYQKLKTIADKSAELPSTGNRTDLAIHCLRQFKNDIDNIFWDEYDCDKICRLINEKYYDLMLKLKGEM